MLSSNQSPEANALERYYCAANVHFDGGVQDDNLKEMWLSPEEKLTYEVRIGDLLVVEGGAGAGGSAIVKKQDGKVYMQNSILRLRPGDSADNRYLVYWIERLVKSDYMGLVCNKATIPHFTKQKLGFTQMPLPPLAEQRRIADKLDKICGIVDELRANIEKEIAALGEYRKSLITRCVTKGIPAERWRRPRRLKPSGVDWIGDVPEVWTSDKFSYLFYFSKGLNITRSDLTEDGVSVVSYGQIHSKKNDGVHLTDELLRHIPETLVRDCASSKLKENDFVFADTSEDLEGIGNCVRVDRPILDYAGYHSLIARPNGQVDSGYLAYQFKSDLWRQQLRMKATSVKVYTISQRLFKGVTVLLPPLDEQREIAAYLDRQCVAIDAKVAERTRQLGKLAEYRKSVIYEYVTGKKVA